MIKVREFDMLNHRVPFAQYIFCLQMLLPGGSSSRAAATDIILAVARQLEAGYAGE
jgi:hypothetical protein